MSDILTREQLRALLEHSNLKQVERDTGISTYRLRAIRGTLYNPRLNDLETLTTYFRKDTT